MADYEQDPQTAAALAHELEQLAASSIRRLQQVIDLPITSELDQDQARAVRAIIAAAATGLNTQLRADSLRLRAARQDLALDRLISLLRHKEKIVPHNSNGSLGDGREALRSEV